MPEVTALDSYAAVDAAAWDALIGEQAPFLEHAYLYALERSGAACPATGWWPRPVVLHEQGALIGAAPGWLTTHSRGEFVYDHAWADAAARYGIAYYPKLVVGVPFTPVAGGRLLVHPSAEPSATRRALLDGLVRAASAAHGLHILFNPEEEATWLAQRGLFPRLQFQYQWENRGWATFEDFLGALTAKKRKNIRQERAKAAHYELEWHEDPAGEVLDHLQRCYAHTCDQFGAWGARYLNRDTFEALSVSWRGRVLGLTARLDGELVAGAYLVRKGAALYGRYWGALGEHPFLHFELCYYAPIELCLREGIQRFEPGHGGEHKLARGFVPQLTWSSHGLAHRGLHDALLQHSAAEAARVREVADELAGVGSPYRR